MTCYADTSGSDSAEQELTDLEGALEDMYEKVEELQQVLKEHLSTKNALKVCYRAEMLLTSYAQCRQTLYGMIHVWPKLAEPM